MHEPKTCEYCQRAFSPDYRVTAKYWAKRRFCSDECRSKGMAGEPRKAWVHKRQPIEARFWAKVQRGEGCWLWISSCDGCGYGTLGKPGRSAGKVKAHRFSWELHNGPIPNGMHVLHRCDNPPCVNPAHLFLGTHQDNMRDRDAKGRGANNGDWSKVGDRRGLKNGNARLSEEQVAEVRERYLAGETQQAIADRIGCRQAHVSRIVRGEQRK